MADIDDFYADIIGRVSDSKLDVSPSGRVVALFRVAVEYGAVHMGIPTLTYLMSRLLTVTLGVMVGDKDATYDDILEEFDTEGEVPH
jgi:hypothetical protein